MKCPKVHYMKNCALAFLICIILIMAAAVPAFAAVTTPTVILDGKILSFDVQPQIDNNYLMVPLRDMFEAMGATVSWDSSTKTVTATKGSTTAALPLNSLSATINNAPYVLDGAAKIANGRILAPLDFVLDALGAQVVWDDSTTTAIVADGPNSQIFIKSKSVNGFDRLQHKVVNGNTDLLYPTVTDMNNTTAEDQINNTIVQQVYGCYQLAWVGQSDPRTSYTVRYKVGLNQNGLCSLVLMESAFPYHAANPNDAQVSLTFDATGKLYQLKDLFASQSDYVGRINSLVKRQFQEQGITMLTPFETISSNQNYYLTPDGIVVYFQSGEYTPEYYGSPEFLIPFSDITDLLAPQSPLTIDQTATAISSLPAPIQSLSIADDSPASIWWNPQDQSNVISQVSAWLQAADLYMGKIPPSAQVMVMDYLGPSRLYLKTSENQTISIYPAYYFTETEDTQDGENLIHVQYVQNVVACDNGQSVSYFQSEPLFNWLKTDQWKNEFNIS